MIFRPEGTHVIVGGTGGLGRSMAKYMIEHGARHIVLLSRSGGGKEMIHRLQRQMQHHGARIIVMRCDASDEAQVRELIEDCKKGLPPICGVIHAAMVLRVSQGPPQAAKSAALTSETAGCPARKHVA